jgi:hypothetical protein
LENSLTLVKRADFPPFSNFKHAKDMLRNLDETQAAINEINTDKKVVLLEGQLFYMNNIKVSCTSAAP